MRPVTMILLAVMIILIVLLISRPVLSVAANRLLNPTELGTSRVDGSGQFGASIAAHTFAGAEWTGMLAFLAPGISEPET